MNNKRVDINKIMADPKLRRKLMIGTIVATQAREGIDTTEEQAGAAYDKVTRSWNGLCEANKHGLDYPEQPCDVCAHDAGKHKRKNRGCRVCKSQGELP